MKKFLFNNLWMKLFALALALGVWSAVQMQIRKETIQPSAPSKTIVNRTLTQVPIYVMQSPFDTNIYGLVPREASVEISGSRDAVNSAKPSTLTLYVSVGPEEISSASPTEDTNMVAIVKEVQRKFPTEITLLNIQPDRVRLIAKTPLKTNSVPIVVPLPAATNQVAN